MRRLLFPLAVFATVTLAAFLLWAWTSDYFLKLRCRDAGGIWDAPTRTCQVSAGPVRRVIVSRPD